MAYFLGGARLQGPTLMTSCQSPSLLASSQIATCQTRNHKHFNASLLWAPFPSKTLKIEERKGGWRTGGPGPEQPSRQGVSQKAIASQPQTRIPHGNQNLELHNQTITSRTRRRGTAGAKESGDDHAAEQSANCSVAEQLLAASGDAPTTLACLFTESP